MAKQPETSKVRGTKAGVLTIDAPHYGYFSLNWGAFPRHAATGPWGNRIKSTITRPGYWAAEMTINAYWLATYEFD